MGTASALLEEAIAAVTDRQNELAGEQEKKELHSETQNLTAVDWEQEVGADAKVLANEKTSWTWTHTWICVRFFGIAFQRSCPERKMQKY